MAPPETCPAAVSGANVSVQEKDDGVAMTFTTKGDVAELRKRVEAMAARINAHAGMGMMGGGMGRMRGRGAMMGDAGAAYRGMMPNARASVEPVDDGARLVLTSQDPADRDRLRAYVQHHEAMMHGGQCPMGMMYMGPDGGAMMGR